MRCAMVEQGWEIGGCLVEMPDGRRARACRVALREDDGVYSRLIKSAHLSRPEHYYSIYQSGCNHDCRKCHSWDFSKHLNGSWYTNEQIANLARAYERQVTWWEPRERATMFHGASLCRSCGSCIIRGSPGPLCPGVLEPGQVVLGPQGWGPVRNIVAFTGGDIACRSDYYAHVTECIKKRTSNIWVLLETNGWGLTPPNLDQLAAAGLDAFWLDIKAFHEAVYRRLCGTGNETVLQAPAEILSRGFTLEVLTLFIPGWVETDQITAIARLIAALDPNVPFTILAFFPAHKMQRTRPPTLREMIEACEAVCDAGLRQVRLGNCGIFVRGAEQWAILMERVGAERIG
jgi:pyruvate formate lyase activating enzyme